MASNVFECEVCNEDYNSEERKPLSLSCGHTFCHKCLSRQLAMSMPQCPTCRRSAVGVQLVNLPVIYALIPSKEKLFQETRQLPSADQCKSHGYNFDYFCTVCGDIVCRKCSKQFHAHHRVEFIEDIVDRDELSTKFVNELQGKMQANVDRVSKFLSLTNDISQSLNATSFWEKGLPPYQDLFQSQITAVTHDLQTWQNSEPKSTEEKRELFKKLRQYWTDEEKVVLDKQEVTNLHKNVDELTAAAQKILKLTSDLKLRLQEEDDRLQEYELLQEDERLQDSELMEQGAGRWQQGAGHRKPRNGFPDFYSQYHPGASNSSQQHYRSVGLPYDSGYQR